MEPEKQPKSEKPSNLKSTEKAFDVTNRSAGMPSSNSRPTIITHRTIMRDPMVAPSQDTEVVHDESGNGPIGQPQPTPPKITKTRIEPLHTDVTAEQSFDGETNSEAEENSDGIVAVSVKESGAKEVSPSEASPEPVTPPSAPAKDEDENEDLDEMTELAGQAAAKKAKKTEEVEEDKRQAAIQKLIESKKYNLPIHSSHAQPLRQRIFIIAGIVFIIAAVVSILVIDAGMIDAGFELPFDLI